MSIKAPRSPALRCCILAAAGVLVAAASYAPAAVAAPLADPCGAITQSQLARAFHLADAQKQSTVLRAPGNPAGVIHDRCHVLAWSGKKPITGKETEAIRKSLAADARLETWVPDDTPFVSNWHQNYAGKIKGLTSRARATFVEGSLDGRAVAVAKYGAERSLAFIAPSGRLRKVRAFWWSPGEAKIVSINAVVARGEPVLEAVKAIAAKVVPAIG